MIATADNLLGIGLYTVDEAARYARLMTRTVNRWVFGDAAGESVVEAQLSKSGEKVVTFLDFIQTLAVRSVRVSENKFPLQKIRQACQRAAKDCNLSFPLAAKDHRIFIFGPRDNPKKCEMIIRIGSDDAGEDVYRQLTGKKAGNMMITKIVEPFMQGVEFGDSAFAERYVALASGKTKIVMDPHHRFGEPYLPSCGYTALALWEAYRAEGGAERAARAFGVSVKEIELACSYYDYLTGNDAA
jgi:hypothetical protein